jgi:hypothetical protein
MAQRTEMYFQLQLPAMLTISQHGHKAYSKEAIIIAVIKIATGKTFGEFLFDSGQIVSFLWRGCSCSMLRKLVVIVEVPIELPLLFLLIWRPKILKTKNKKTESEP